jgi:hypothetical protein
VLVAGTDGQSRFAGNYTTGSSTPGIALAASADTQGAWHCVEMMATRPSGRAFCIDDALVATANDAFISPKFTLVGLGTSKATNNGDVHIDVDTDDVVIDSQRIGCD